MPVISQSEGSVQPESTNRNLMVPFILVTSLFFMWGFSYGLLDVLNKHFQETLSITKSRSTLLQAAYFGAYFLMAIPAGLIMKKYGYKSGIIIGLILYAIGAFLFYPSANLRSFEFFLLALFIVASGITCLETAANPYITILGPKHSSEFRLNLSQSFNGVGSFVGPIIAANLFFASSSKETAGDDLASVKFVYLVVGGVVLAIAVLFLLSYLPEIKEKEAPVENTGTTSLFRISHFRWAVIAQFFYVAAQVGVGALFINYVTEYWKGMDNEDAAYLLSVSMLLFTIGRFVGTALLKRVPASSLLTAYAVINSVLCVLIMLMPGKVAVVALIIVFFFMSIMFPTIFALGVKGLGENTKKASSFIIMSIVGGALVPPLMGVISNNSTALSFVVPLVCFLIVTYYGWKKANPPAQFEI